MHPNPRPAREAGDDAFRLSLREIIEAACGGGGAVGSAALRRWMAFVIFEFWMVSLGASFFDESFFPLVSKLTTDSYMEIHPEGRKGKKKGAYLMSVSRHSFTLSPVCRPGKGRQTNLF